MKLNKDSSLLLFYNFGDISKMYYCILETGNVLHNKVCYFNPA